MPRVSDVSDDSSASDSQAGESTADAFQNAGRHAREVAAFAEYYISAKLDALRTSVRRAVLYAVLGVAAAVAGMTLVVMAVVLTVIGLSDLVNWALHFAFGGLSPWIGPLIVGVGILVVMGVGGMVLMSWQIRGRRRRMVKKYEQKRRKQREQFGRDVRGASSARK